MKVTLVGDGICPLCGAFRIMLQCAKDITDKPVAVIYCFNAWIMRATKQHSTTPKERLDIIGHISKGLPYKRRNG
jgi:hypothetical protein